MDSRGAHRESSLGEKGSKKFFAFGHNWVVLAVWVPLPWNCERGMAIPILFRLYRGKKRCPKRQYRKRTELAAELVELLASWLSPDERLHVVGDAEYACETLVRDLPDSIYFTGPIVMDAAVYAKPGKYAGRGRHRVKGPRLHSPSELTRCSSVAWREVTLTIYGQEVTILTKTQECMWYSVSGARWGRMVVTRDPSGRLKDRAFFSTKPHASVKDVLSQFARRWEIEVTFRNTRQVVGLQDPQNGWWRTKSGKPERKTGVSPFRHVRNDETPDEARTEFVQIAIAFSFGPGVCADPALGDSPTSTDQGPMWQEVLDILAYPPEDRVRRNSRELNILPE
jgi:hypothetical protein